MSTENKIRLFRELSEESLEDFIDRPCINHTQIHHDLGDPIYIYNIKVQINTYR